MMLSILNCGSRRVISGSGPKGTNEFELGELVLSSDDGVKFPTLF